MKKHPIDDLFKRRLSELERRPSSAAWARIAEKQQRKERKFGIWMWYAAAGMVVVIMAGYLVWQNSQSPVAERTLAGIEKPLLVPKKITDEVSNDLLVISERTPEPEIANVDERPAKWVSSGIGKAGKPAQIISKEAGSVVDNSVKVRMADQLASIPINEPEADTLRATVPSFEKINNSEPMLAAVSKKEENRIIVVHVETGDNEVNEKHKTSKFSKVFRQLKNARAGEPVDWQEVGINPQNIFAKVEGRGRGKDGENSEQDQNKGRTKF